MGNLGKRLAVRVAHLLEVADMPKLVLNGITVVDVRAAYPDKPNQSIGWDHPMSWLMGLSIHHDGEYMAEGDQDYNGTTLDEDVERLNAIYNWNYDRLGGFPYHLVASPNGRLFLCRDLGTWGAHTGGMNDRLGGIALMGNFMEREPSVKSICAASLACIVYWRELDRLVETKGHTDWNQNSECPGPFRGIWIPKVLQFAAINSKIYTG